MTTVATKMAPNGRITFPARIRAAVGLEKGGDVVVEVVDGELHVRGVAQAVERARACATIDTRQGPRHGGGLPGRAAARGRTRTVTVVLDASALIAALRDEPGRERVDGLIGEAVMTTVNLAEVVGHFTRSGMASSDIAAALAALGVTVELIR